MNGCIGEDKSVEESVLQELKMVMTQVSYLKKKQERMRAVNNYSSMTHGTHY